MGNRHSKFLFNRVSLSNRYQCNNSRYKGNSRCLFNSRYLFNCSRYQCNSRYLFSKLDSSNRFLKASPKCSSNPLVANFSNSSYPSNLPWASTLCQLTAGVARPLRPSQCQSNNNSQDRVESSLRTTETTCHIIIASFETHTHKIPVCDTEVAKKIPSNQRA